MNTAIVEVTNGPANWGKFLVGQFDEAEWARRSALTPTCTDFKPDHNGECLNCDDWADAHEPSTVPLLQQIGWQPGNGYVFVLDLQTGEGAVFRRGGLASADLNKHAVWVCPMFEPFLEWLYRAWDGSLASLPPTLDLPDAPFAMHGYRRPGGPST